MSEGLRVAVVGATGLVGTEMLKILEERKFPIRELVPVASRADGRTVRFAGSDHEVVAISEEAFQGIDLALFSAGGGPSKTWSPVAAAAGALVIDNSSAFRRDPDVPLCVPEVNLEAARNPKKGIIANPNCSTIQMVVVLKPLHDAARIRRVVVATYQAISGAGASAVAAFREQARAFGNERPVPKGAIGDVLAGDLLMHWSRDVATGYQEEELKMVHETQKILGDDSIRVSPTAVRVPVAMSHSEAITIEFERPLTPGLAREILSQAAGIEIVDDFTRGRYPKPSDATGTDPVYVGRIREDVGNPGGIQLWCVADNIRKGAALNAIQIAEGLMPLKG